MNEGKLYKWFDLGGSPNDWHLIIRAMPLHNGRHAMVVADNSFAKSRTILGLDVDRTYPIGKVAVILDNFENRTNFIELQDPLDILKEML